MHNAGMIYGYARVSTDAQDLTSQLAQLKAAGCEKVFREKIIGTPPTDRSLERWSLPLVTAMCHHPRRWPPLAWYNRSAGDRPRHAARLRSIAEPVVDTTSDLAELVLAMLGVAAKLERRRIAERTARGRADAKAKGIKLGRKPALTPHQQQEARKRLAEGEQRSVARGYNVSQATISRLAV
jgi:DNA invertase Pin-like site-specific DNA recombinase